MRITPMDIQQQQFKTRPFGYDKGSVDSFLEQVADELEAVHRRQQELKEEMARLRSAVEEMRQREATLKETLLTTQRMTDEIKANARKEAE
ncbi:MAG TPA: DivIVA domain-containing protein, partial [Desulfuromonadales bacterium]|nr:DivIVA domain-containing protein [Desulfuromonadales bacterium]